MVNFFRQLFHPSNEVLGINERNLTYISRSNDKRAFSIANNKLLTKRVLTENAISTPQLICYISKYSQISKFKFDSLPNSFVIKPAKGTEGSGIEIFYNKDKYGNYIASNGKKWSETDILNHIRRILDGDFSMTNQPDTAIFEQRIKVTKAFRNFVRVGTPDIRIIIFNKIPVMSYIRIPTKASMGKANLALGAIACGIDMANGTTTHGVSGKSDIIEKFPGTNKSVSGIKIPHWNKMLELSIKTSQVTNLGYCGVDFLIDRDLGPVIVELNARPGLSIQIANDDSLRWRLRKARGIKIGKNFKKAIRVSKDLFGGEIQDEIEDISGKTVVGLNPLLSFKGSEGNISEEFEAVLDLNKKYSYISTSFANNELQLDSSVKVHELTYYINGKSFTNKFILKDEISNIVLGQNALSNLLIDMSQK